jgi:hypothetical protein
MNTLLESDRSFSAPEDLPHMVTLKKNDNHKPRIDEGLILVYLLCTFLHFRSDEMPLHGCKILSLSLSKERKKEHMDGIKVSVKLFLGLIKRRFWMYGKEETRVYRRNGSK